jgi:molybdopterin molybdotransferase
MVFHGIAVKPGKPTLFALVGRHAVLRHAGQSDIVPVERVHPARAVSQSHRTTPPLRARRRVSARLDRIVSQAGRHQFYTFACRRRALPAFKGSGEITSLSQADGYIEIPASQTPSTRHRPSM